MIIYAIFTNFESIMCASLGITYVSDLVNLKPLVVSSLCLGATASGLQVLRLLRSKYLD